jgi:octaprenyl-diphosphate synthase
VERPDAKPVRFAMKPYLAELYEPLGTGFEAVRRAFDDELFSDLPFVNTLCEHVGRYRGKMLRPALVLLSGQACGKVTREHEIVAAVVEMVHMATLVHDDVLDEAEIRRGLVSLNRLQGNEAAVMFGDFLISHAFHLCSSLDSQYASRLIGSTTNTVCEGELMQIYHRGDLNITEDDYMQIISRKTASLTATCCVLGARYADADAATIGQLEAYGLNAGIAFQIADDLLDLLGDEQEVGKTLGLDLKRRELTLPTIHLLTRGPTAARAEARRLLGNGDARRLDRIRRLVLDAGSVDYSRQVARRHVEAALASLADLPPSPARDSLQAMARFVIERRT